MAPASLAPLGSVWYGRSTGSGECGSGRCAGLVFDAVIADAPAPVTRRVDFQLRPGAWCGGRCPLSGCWLVQGWVHFWGGPIHARSGIVARKSWRLLAYPELCLLQKHQVRALGCQPCSELGQPGPYSVAVELHELEVLRPVPTSSVLLFAPVSWAAPCCPGFGVRGLFGPPIGGPRVALDVAGLKP